MFYTYYMDLKIFKPFDIRGIYPREINRKAVYGVARGYAAHLQEKTGKHNLKIIVGRDARVSSPELHRGVIDGLTEEGIEIIDTGLSTSPMHYFAVNYLKADGGIMITASHNPKEWNGLKLSREKAIPLIQDGGMESIKSKIQNSKSKTTTKNFGSVKSVDLKSDYVEFLMRGAKIKKKFKIVVDGGNGMVGIVLPQLLEKFGVEFIPLYLEPDGNFPNHEANPLKEETLAKLKEKVGETGADFGVAFDGDADRIGFIGSGGKKINGDFITAILTENFLKTDPGSSVVYPRPSSKAVSFVVEKNKGNGVAARTGHSFIKEAMRKNDAIFGGEGSGHYYFRDFFYADGAVFALIKMLQLLDGEIKNLDELAAFFENRYFISPEISFSVKDDNDVLTELEKKYSDGKIDKIDGLSVEYDNWWFNARQSGTEPVLRLKIEADSSELLKNKTEELVGILA